MSEKNEQMEPYELDDGAPLEGKAVGMLPWFGQAYDDDYLPVESSTRLKHRAPRRSSSKWLPLVLVAAIAVLAVFFSFILSKIMPSITRSSAETPVASSGDAPAVDIGAYQTVRVSYRQGFGSNESVGETVTLNAGSSHVVDKWSASSGHGEFLGWADEATGEMFQPGDVIEDITRDIVLVAQWHYEEPAAAPAPSETSAAEQSSADAAPGTLSASSLPKNWTGSYVGMVNGQTDNTRISMSLNFRNDGTVDGTVVAYSSSDGGRAGSYSVVGVVNYISGEIYLSWAGWIEPGNLTVTRSFEGVITGNSIAGTSKNMESGVSTSWSMTAG